ncbi:unnamed protein product, partial [Mesorhabditis belari]|uniref:Galectin n=1 Tax=Mesorhabditis belari TaxID=2138241 RepID=A0AAF3FDB5_9BILA
MTAQREFTYGPDWSLQQIDGTRIHFICAGFTRWTFDFQDRNLDCKFLRNSKARIVCRNVVEEGYQNGQLVAGAPITLILNFDSAISFGLFAHGITDMSGDASSHSVSHHRFITSQGSAFIIAPVS